MSGNRHLVNIDHQKDGLSRLPRLRPLSRDEMASLGVCTESSAHTVVAASAAAPVQPSGRTASAPMRSSVTLPERWPRIEPWSWRSFAASLLLVLASVAAQMILVDLGLELAFAAFFPAVLVSGFLGGKPAGTFAAVVTFPLVWWTFLPPAFEFSPLGTAACEDIKLFFLGSVLLVYFADLCRDLDPLDTTPHS
ncbi:MULTISPECIES: DUF4118 domain-containing protein [Bradyrhizobium]|nr:MULTISPECIES: DUF4118 domain-containing protein [Bradyrhizobium]WLB97468.1 DUF4118 domain-containing protein [Bradyrhizobium japonicum USDA 123]MBR0946462.1 DUF4118 domain-containing protein [Bradyrhizobium liaoningense]MBR0999344.1 DUF4118 domain-containing protein [Bradyrhizobium liaoningense]MCP1747092.1 K+-sensing histidine kinase KdpD [Bradyrhizobium japonicum]MCP1865650.1 K+-sensing histidine kinase KdpD [Bradyrhizobium japonicum]